MLTMLHEDVAQALGILTFRYRLLLMVMMAFAVAAALKIVGAL